MSNLYNMIESLCREKGITITQMCKESGTSRGSLSDLKTGRKKSLSIETLQKVADYFKVSVDYLVGDKKLYGVKNLHALNIEQNILSLKNKKHISDMQFCRDLEFPLDAIFLWDEARSDSYLDCLPKIAAYLETTVDDLTGNKIHGLYKSDEEYKDFIKKIRITDPLFEKKEEPTQKVQANQKAPRLRSIARLEENLITPEQDKEISNYIDYLLHKKDKK